MSNNLWLNRIKCCLLICMVIVSSIISQAQINVKGPVCVLPGITYKYQIVFSQAQSNVTLRVCIIGGVLKGNEKCTQRNNKNTELLVVWDGTASHSIELNVQGKTTRLEISVAKVLQGGRIVPKEKLQLLKAIPSNVTIVCSPAEGGACNSIYKYQWQKSERGGVWTNIAGADQKNLNYPFNQNTSMRFRRMVNETETNTLAYSDTAIVTQSKVPSKDKWPKKAKKPSQKNGRQQ